MYLVDTDVISEARKGVKANAGVQEFFRKAAREEAPLYLSVVTVGEMRQGIEIIRHRGDQPQADHLEQWLNRITADYSDAILPFDEETAHVWGRLRVPHPENPLDKQIAATALIYDLTVVTRNSDHYEPTGVRFLNPFS
ncbi:type II toxin-antitoxin system VapC family toxin [Steroidobacter sp.]|uniref:type II toxin-antitoxin system VapC family toxin n=1 Tax=Steroidobacter sp. TaxID=1978227 RepID=UPI001A518382|nr:type II toxin-antitoxin system VapC family toxin [Steroidobacter sp.]MBL8271593.1 type II toxin-antitoxin system VapC family toxin [Steroidobacter sp.]